jgi:SAM-dependent methyltransferase
MSPDREHSCGPARHAVANDYDSFAEAYAAETESNLLNGYYARPAILDLAGEVAGRRILDVGCGAGPLLEPLRDRGAIVTGVDPSIKMLELARQRLGEGAVLHQAGLGGGPLPFPDGAFDDAIVCLVLHYLEDWKAPLAELRRVLAPGGRLIVAVNHPSATSCSIPMPTTSQPLRTWHGRLGGRLGAWRGARGGQMAAVVPEQDHRMIPHASWSQPSTQKTGTRS